ncbi:hypothetical protein Q8A67_018719 [Cirrhinus molitorella]|uniref:Uncharacterized protein n=1 Tax=Cirrhinus molitorella TaxID=172907 RepID=A0AA88PGV0_9TELE|nr:hypothetical protein Q8A67_018719 [Cirrhinus molitorella]
MREQPLPVFRIVLQLEVQHIAGMSESNSPSSDSPNDAQRPSASADAAQPNSRQVSEIEPSAAPRGRRPSRAASHTPRRQLQALDRR